MRKLMSLASFGSVYGGLATVGYQLYDHRRCPVGARQTAGVTEKGKSGSGIYGALVAIPHDFRGLILWDTGGSSPAYAARDVNLRDDATVRAVEYPTSVVSFGTSK